MSKKKVTLVCISDRPVKLTDDPVTYHFGDKMEVSLERAEAIMGRRRVKWSTEKDFKEILKAREKWLAEQKKAMKEKKEEKTPEKESE